MRSITRTPSFPPSTDLTRGSGGEEAAPPAASTATAHKRAGSPIPDGLASRPPPRDIRAHDKQLASYVMGRAVDGRAIEGGDLDQLRQANDLLQQTREAIPIGRGNVTTDIEASNGHSYRTSSAARVVRNSRKLNALPVHRAAIAEIAGAGNCGEHAAVAVYKLATQLSAGQEAHCVVNRKEDHGWAELRTPAPADERPTIVLDAWAEGPAIHAEDGAFASPAIPVEHRESDYSYDAHTAPPALAEKAAFHAEQAGVLGARITTVRRGMAAMKFKQRETFPPLPVIHGDFANRVSEKMAHVDHAVMRRLGLPPVASTGLRNDLLATSVLMQLGASVSDATAAAREVSVGAGALARAPQNPPRKPAAGRQARAAAIDRPVPQTLPAQSHASPADAAQAPSTSGRAREPEPDADH